MTTHRCRPPQLAGGRAALGAAAVPVVGAVTLAAVAALGAAALAAAGPTVAQESEQEAVLAVVERLFEGMRTADSALVRSTFHPDAVLIGTEDGEGNPATRIRPIDGFVRAVGGAGAEWHEPFWNWEVRIEDHLASVWTRYAFYLDRELTHCGVDAFLLARSQEGWRIVSLADTRQREGCAEPPPDAR